jgi:hypothetical protein
VDGQHRGSKNKFKINYNYLRKLFAFIRKLFILHPSVHQTDKKHLNLNQYHNNTYQIAEVLLLADEDR